MGSHTSPTSFLLASDSAYPRIRPAKLNTHWSASKTPFDCTTSKFTRWSTKLEIFLQQSGLDRYIFAPETKPERLIRQLDPVTEPVAYSNWLSNNNLIIGIICTVVLDAEQEGLATDGTAKECYDALKARAQREGLVKQVALIREALSTFAPISKPIEHTAQKICNLIDHALAIGMINRDLLKCIALLNSINNKTFESVQTQISRGLANLTKDKPYTSSDTCKLFQTIDSLATLLRPADTALAATSAKSMAGMHNHGPGYPCCKLCLGLGLSCRGHTKAWCIRLGGGMARKTIKESKATQKAAQGGGNKQNTASNNNVPKNSIAVKDLNGQAYIIDITHLQKVQIDTAAKVEQKVPEFAAVAMNSTNFFKYQGFMAVKDDKPREITSIDWGNHVTQDCKTILATTVVAPLNQLERTSLVLLNKKPFFLDSGATVHISPCRSDFITLRAIPSQMVKEIGGLSIEAVGIGQIRLHIQKKAEIILENVLYIPTSTVRLISVSALATGMRASITFSATGVTILNNVSGMLIASGPLILGRRLYTLELQAALAKHALTAIPKPMNLNKWHWQLGHANYQVVAEIAPARMLEGMPHASLHAQPKCDLCILGKQTKSPVPKVREEGHRATRVLEIIWIDLAGPMHVQWRTGNKYIMDLVNDYTNMPWSIPLRSKSDAVMALQAWERARTLETGKQVSIYHTGHNGELKNHEMSKWLASTGTRHELSAPYTSQHMGQVERMHRTLLSKARTMQIAAKCPEFLWDEFYATTDNDASNNNIPDLANVATQDNIEHLLNTVESLGDPVSLEANNKPRTWKEAQNSPDADRWEEAYRNELESLKQMGVYKLVPWEEVPSGHKV